MNPIPRFNNSVVKQLEKIRRLYILGDIDEDMMEYIWKEMQLKEEPIVIYSLKWSASNIPEHLSVNMIDNIIMNVLNTAKPKSWSRVSLMRILSYWDERAVNFFCLKGSKTSWTCSSSKVRASDYEVANAFIDIINSKAYSPKDKYEKICKLVNEKDTSGIIEINDIINAFSDEIGHFSNFITNPDTSCFFVKRCHDAIDSLLCQGASLTSIQAYRNIIGIASNYIADAKRQSTIEEFLKRQGKEYVKHMPDIKFSFPLVFEDYLSLISIKRDELISKVEEED